MRDIWVICKQSPAGEMRVFAHVAAQAPTWEIPPKNAVENKLALGLSVRLFFNKETAEKKADSVKNVCRGWKMSVITLPELLALLEKLT